MREWGGSGVTWTTSSRTTTGICSRRLGGYYALLHAFGLLVNRRGHLRRRAGVLLAAAVGLWAAVGRTARSTDLVSREPGTCHPGGGDRRDPDRGRAGPGPGDPTARRSHGGGACGRPGPVALNLVWKVVWGNHPPPSLLSGSLGGFFPLGPRGGGGGGLRRESATARAQLAALDIARGPGGTRPPSVPRLQARRGHGRRLLRGRGRVRRFAGAHDCGAAPCVRAEPRSRRRGAGTRARGEARARSCGLRGRRTRRRASERSGGRDEARVLDDHADRPGRHGRAESAVSPRESCSGRAPAAASSSRGAASGIASRSGSGHYEAAPGSSPLRSAAPRTRGISGPV